MDMSPVVRDRIYSAADALYEEGGRQTYPTVDAVRKLAKVNMNDASSGVKAWRREKSCQIAPAAIQVPDALQRANTATLAALWSEAVALANETLRAAQSDWDIERAEAEALSEQMADAYEAQAIELETANTEVTRLRFDIEHANGALRSLQLQSEDTLRQVAQANAAAKQADVRTVEIERRADELRKELDYAHAAALENAKEALEARDALGNEVQALRAELAKARQKAEHDVATEREALARALETAAMLRGKVDALSEKKPSPAARSHTKKNSDALK